MKPKHGKNSVRSNGVRCIGPLDNLAAALCAPANDTAVSTSSAILQRQSANSLKQNKHQHYQRCLVSKRDAVVFLSIEFAIIFLNPDGWRF